MTKEFERPDLPTHTVTIETKHDNTTHTCWVCQNPMRQILGEEECWGKKNIVRSEQVPSYRCDGCDHEESQMDAHIEFLGKARAVFVEKRDYSVTRVLKEELWAAREVQKIRIKQVSS